jgi:phosphoglycolate phosphatase-like HAD superfamily hydrolase
MAGGVAPSVPKKTARRAAPSPETSTPPADETLRPMASAPGGSLSTSQFAEVAHTVIKDEPTVAPRSIARGLLLFDLDGTILDDIGLIADVAADVLLRAFGTPAPEGRLHYLATTGMPFEAQLSQLYPEAAPQLRDQTARIFHQRKVTEAYAVAGIFPEMPKLLKRLSAAGWTMAVSTGAEREMADLMLEREGLRYWFEDVLGSAQGTKREHLTEYRRRYPSVPIYLVGDSRFDMEAATGTSGVAAIGRASSLLGWTLTPDDLKRWGAVWADYSLAALPEYLEERSRARPGRRTGTKRR